MSTSEKFFLAALQRGLPSALPQFLIAQRWFGGKARTMRSVEVSDVIPFGPNSLRSWFTLVKVNYASAPVETYDLPLIEVSRASSLESSQSVLKIRQQDSGEILLREAI